MRRITFPSRLAPHTGIKIDFPGRSKVPHAQHGVVLVIALILLVLISLLAVSSLRNAGSSESVASNVRTTELATQAADIALRYCESKARELAPGVTPDSTPNQWNTAANWDKPDTDKLWDGTSTSAFVLAKNDVNQPGNATYQRPPECMIEKLPAGTIGYIITARGFGPEVTAVKAGEDRRPKGSEVWLQSTIELNP